MFKNEFLENGEKGDKKSKNDQKKVHEKLDKHEAEKKNKKKNMKAKLASEYHVKIKDTDKKHQDDRILKAELLTVQDALYEEKKNYLPEDEKAIEIKKQIKLNKQKISDLKIKKKESKKAMKILKEKKQMKEAEDKDQLDKEEKEAYNKLTIEVGKDD